MVQAPRPWSGLQPALADLLRPRLAVTVDAAIAAIDRELPAFQGGLDGALGRTIRRGVEVALNRFLDLLGTDDPALDPRSEQIYAALGEGEGAQGRSMDTLLSAYRIGARVTWGHFAADAVRGEVRTDELVVLAEAIFAYIDEISAASAVGYARQQAAEAGHRNVVRSRLAEALLSGAAVADPAKLRRLADDAGWAVPERLAVAVVPHPAEGASRTPRTLADALLLETDVELLALVPDPAGRREQIGSGLGAVPVYLGTARPPEEAAISLAHARAVRRLVEAGTVPGGDVVAAADHLSDLIVAADPSLLEELAGRALAALADVGPRKRAVLEQTLATWLAEQGDRAAVARALHVHPQTVTYRMSRLADLLGEGLGHPAGRLALTLALAGGPAGRAWAQKRSSTSSRVGRPISSRS